VAAMLSPARQPLTLRPARKYSVRLRDACPRGVEPLDLLVIDGVRHHFAQI